MSSTGNKTCRGCHKLVAKSVSCDKCKLYYHPSCASKSNVLNSVGELTCCGALGTDCLNLSSTPSEPSIISAIKELLSVEFNKLNDRISSLKEELRSMYDKQLNEIKTDIASLTIRISLIESKLCVDTSEANISTNLNSSLSEQLPIMESVLKESADRERRSRNLICYNIEESNSSDVKCRIEDDRKLLANAISSFSNIDISHSHIIRLSKSKNGSPRPLKIVLKSSKDVHDILKSKKNYNGPYRFFADLTIRQRNFYKSVKEKLKELHAKGYQGARIKFINGVPSIVNLTNPSRSSGSHLPSTSKSCV